MSSQLRALAKRIVPVRVKRLINDVRDVVAAPPIDDVVLANYRLEPDLAPKPRFNLVIPNLAASSAFGGVTTGLDIFLKVAARLSQTRDIDLRVIFTEPDRETDPAILTARVSGAGLGAVPISFLDVRSVEQAIPVRANDLFVTYNGWVTLNMHPVIAAQAEHFGQPVKPLIYLIQEYEPHMYPFSSAHMLAREAYDRTERLWGIINSSNLQEYFEISGHSAEKAFVFEPVISDKLRPYLDRVSAAERKKQILVYGRPGIDRNCFPALVRGLRRWVRDYPEFADWTLISAGTAHKPIDLGSGRHLTSVGKLSLDDYASMLLSCAAGVSLMASPHPSYPPLEMAHMGLRTITNGYQCKNLEAFHPNITSLRSIGDVALADALADACRQYGKPVNDSRNAVYVRDEFYPFIDELVAAIIVEMA